MKRELGTAYADSCFKKLAYETKNGKPQGIGSLHSRGLATVI